MPAHSDKFPWPSHYGHFEFFESRMADHDRVRAVRTESNGIYEISLFDGRTFRVFICECYAYGAAEYEETVANIDHVDAVIINSNWCGYSPDAKNYCRLRRVGLYTIGEFMAALNFNPMWSYLTKNEKEYFKNRGWNT